jgi:hypothetical protein
MARGALVLVAAEFAVALSGAVWLSIRVRRHGES